MRTSLRALRPLTLAAGAVLIQSPAAQAQQFGAWSAATPVSPVNVAGVNDGCPIESRDGLSLYMASNRPGTAGGNDIWVADRLSKDAPWGPPQNLGAPVNSAANDFCPTPVGGNWLFFVSERTGPDTCAAGPGIGDMYLVHYTLAHGWTEPEHLGCAEAGAGPNTLGAELSPSLVETEQGTYLYFSSNALGTQDLYVSRLGNDGHFGPATRIEELSTAADDRMPNVSKDGLEMVFSSSRTDLAHYGGQDVYTSRRASVSDPWSPPVNLGPNVNTAGNETRSTMSWDRTRLYFGRDGDIYTSTRSRLAGR